MVGDIFNRVLYAGYIEHADWGITRRKGHHEALVSLETYERIQEHKASRMVAPARRDINADFPLRGAVACSDCDAPMTACWSKSSTGKRYPYFWCQTKTCEMYRKSIRAERSDAAFEKMMQSLAPSKGLVSVVKAMLKDAWAQRLKQANAITTNIKRDITGLDKQLDGLLDRIVDTDNSSVIAAYEKKIVKLEARQAVFNRQTGSKGQTKAYT